jgi:hypothetical protein
MNTHIDTNNPTRCCMHELVMIEQELLQMRLLQRKELLSNQDNRAAECQQ